MDASESIHWEVVTSQVKQEFNVVVHWRVKMELECRLRLAVVVKVHVRER